MLHPFTLSFYYPVSLLPRLSCTTQSLVLPSLSFTAQPLLYHTVSFLQHSLFHSLLSSLFTTHSLYYPVFFLQHSLFHYPASLLLPILLYHPVAGTTQSLLLPSLFTTQSLLLPSLFTTQSLLLQKLLHLAPRGCHEDFTTRRRQGPRCRPSAIRLPQGSGKGVGRGVGMWFRHVV